MRLKKLEIHGFKSFADRTEMTFEHGITGIVGPNGCGKSNISDAVRWVLGEQSAKTLRGSKMEDVIFNGTEKRRRLSYCEVVLTFDNEDRSLPIDFAEVAVARRVYRNGDSEYSINRNGCRLRDIVDLFRDTGIGKEGYSLIGQGRIDEILSVKSEDRRQIFEEAAGIVKYKVRKTDAERRMENTRLNLSRVEDILSELNLRVEPLRQQSETAREYLQLQGELKGLELNVFLARSERYTARIEELTQSGHELNEALAQAAAERERLAAERDGAQQALESLEAQAAAGREQVQRLIRDVEAREGAAAVSRERIAAGTREMERLEQQLAAAREGEGGVERQLTALNERADFEQQDMQQAAAALEEERAALAREEAALSAAEAEIEALKAQLIEAMNSLGDVRSEQARLRALDEQLRGRVAQLRVDEQSGAGQAQDFEAAARNAQQRLEQERAEKQTLDELAERAAQRVRELSEQADACSAEMRELTAKRQETASRLRVLEEMQRDYEGYQHSVKNVLLQARRTSASGVRGVVASLIHVPARLERAIEMVLGGALQNVVVDREEDAKRMIDYLRQNRLGRATFLPISAVRGRTLDAAERRVLSMPGCVGLASELVSFDAEYQGVVDNLLGRTVVAENLDAGIAIMRAGRHAFRLVTLEGDVMHSGGSMTGGSVQSRMTSLLSREREVNEHRQTLSQLVAQLEQAEARALEINQARADVKRERTELFERVHQQEIACAREEAHLTAARAELEAHLKRSQRVEGERERLEQQLKEVAASLDGIASRQVDEERGNRERQAEIAQRQRALGETRVRVAAQQKRVLDGSVAQAARERGLDSLRADIKRLNEQKGDLGRLLRESLAQREACEGQLQLGREQLAEDERALAELKQALDEARARFNQADGERTGAQERLRTLTETADRLREQVESLSDRQHRAEVQLTRVEGEFKQLTDRIWEDYELSYEGAQPFRDPDFRLTDSEKRIAQIRQRIRAMGSVNVSAVDEYRQTVERFEQMSTQRDDLLRAQLDLQSIIEELTKKMEVQFKSQFELMNAHFQRTFVKLFGGGHAELRLSDPKDALNCGIEIVAQPPGKKLQMLSLLSGGERALTAIAILFAMLTLKPTPFCFLDEIEAALDDANIDNFAEYLHEFSKNTQFVVVTHRKGTMERCDALYGVAMEEKGVSRMVSVRLSEGIQHL